MFFSKDDDDDDDDEVEDLFQAPVPPADFDCGTDGDDDDEEDLFQAKVPPADFGCISSDRFICLLSKTCSQRLLLEGRGGSRRLSLRGGWRDLDAPCVRTPDLWDLFDEKQSRHLGKLPIYVEPSSALISLLHSVHRFIF